MRMILLIGLFLFAAGCQAEQVPEVRQPQVREWLESSGAGQEILEEAGDNCRSVRLSD